jgi:hypothetical protein
MVRGDQVSMRESEKHVGGSPGVGCERWIGRKRHEGGWRGVVFNE